MIIDNDEGESGSIGEEKRAYDSSCPHYEFLWSGLSRSGERSHCCTLKYQYDEYGYPKDYGFCESGSYKSCPTYLSRQRGAEILEREREEIVNFSGFGD